MAEGALLLASGSDAADRRARFAVVSRDAPSADAALDTDMPGSSSAVPMLDSCTSNEPGTADRAKLMSSMQLSGVRWSSCESSNGGVPEPRPRLTGAGPPSVSTRRGRYLAVHRYAPQNTSTGSSTSGIDMSMSSSRSELVWPVAGRRRSAAALTAGCVGVTTVVSSLDADCEDNCDDLADDSLSLYRSSSFRRAIERGGNASPPTPTAADDAAADKPSDQQCFSTHRLMSAAQLSTAAFYRQPVDASVSYRLTAECSRVDVTNPCVSPDDSSTAVRAAWDVNVETNSQHIEDIDPFCCYGLSPELG